VPDGAAGRGGAAIERILLGGLALARVANGIVAITTIVGQAAQPEPVALAALAVARRWSRAHGRRRGG
jgi:hypothetical protein